MGIEIVDFPIKIGDFPLLCECLPEAIFTGHEMTMTRQNLSFNTSLQGHQDEDSLEGVCLSRLIVPY
jgi:tRNA pseudouridine-54 N-methylase